MRYSKGKISLKKKMKRMLITGGAGFIGSSLAIGFKQDLPYVKVVAFDNLRRRGSELAIGRLKNAEVEFIHGDIRNSEDIDRIGPFDLLIDCSAEPSVYAGYDSSPVYLLNTNLNGTINCLEAARRHRADIIFLSTSRVYPIKPMRSLPFEKKGRRFVIPKEKSGPGWSDKGITEEFTLSGNRSIYGATKLCSELLISEYSAMYEIRAIINRCGVLTGPWQMGKVDQGFVVLWAARHLYGGQLNYIGYGGDGLQIRDILHVNDLYNLVRLQLQEFDEHNGCIYNVGGGVSLSISLKELTLKCEVLSGRSMDIGKDPATRDADIPYYITDHSLISKRTGWTATRGIDNILDEIFKWLRDYRETLFSILS